MALVHSFSAISSTFRPCTWSNRFTSPADSRSCHTNNVKPPSGLRLTPPPFSSQPSLRSGKVLASVQGSSETDESLVVCFGEMLIDFVGEDEFGYMLADILKENNVNNEGMRFDPGARTALAFVTLKKDGEREFMFYRNPIQKDAGVLLSYDPNLRLPLWPSAESAREGILSIWDTADIIKEFSGRVKGIKVDPVDTTGAGDAFVAGVLSKIAADTSLLKDEKRLRDALRFANACGAITVTERGAIPALPTTEAVMNALLKTVKFSFCKSTLYIIQLSFFHNGEPLDVFVV
ncbi:probable fructokinase-6, chloroplastic [Tanacetum coccineum]|uniref:Probable fructokinase-6, chloroplastic n=1 Tax=Tanacetum coccineum TaxID=301880 RepID=A0ABQ5EAG1_9ASTR